MVGSPSKLGHLLCVILIAVGPVIGSAAEEADPGCPPNLRAWRSHGDAEPGGEWSADILEIQGDIGILREVLIRFGQGTLPPDEARWFDAPSVLEPDSLHTRTLSFMGDELLDYCRYLTGSQIESLREKSRPRCLVSDSGAQMMLSAMLTVTDSDPQQPEPRVEGGIGVMVGGGQVDEDELECERVAELTSAFDPQDLRESGSEAFDSIYAMLEETAGTDGPVETGLAAVPVARHLLEILGEVDKKRVPENLPSEFYLTVTAASGAYAESLALDRMLTEDAPDEEVALKLLGDFASPAATALVQLKLRASVAAQRAEIGSLALRALLAADPEVARFEAQTLLSNPAFLRPALGVFALTDPTIRDDLDSLDLDDEEALAEAGARVLAHLEALGPPGLEPATNGL